MAVSDAELDDIQRDAESTARLVGAPGSPVRLRASATVRLVEEVRRLRGALGEILGLRDALAKAAPRPWRVVDRGDSWAVLTRDAQYSWEVGATAFDDGTADGEHESRCSTETRDALIALVHAADRLSGGDS